MKVRNIVLGAAAVALACATTSVRAADQSAMAAGAGVVAPSADVSMQPVYMQAASGPTSLTPAMYLLNQNSFGQWMVANGYSITGFVEGGYFYDTSNPRLGSDAGKGQDSPTDIAFPGAYSNRGLLDQADLTVQKTFVSGKTFDWGFQIEGGYGTDDAQIHGYGILDNRAGGSIYNKFNTNPNAGHPQNQMDLIQANVSVLLPVGSGLTIQAGKFVTLLSNEVINPTGNAFYTHSYNFSFGVPATQTGILGSYTFGKALNGNDLTITGGATRGWNEASRDNNGEIDFLGEIKGNITDKVSLTLNVSEGPETYRYDVGAAAAAGTPASHYVGEFKGDSSNYQTVLEALPSVKISDQLTLTVDLLWGDLPHGSLSDAGHTAQWYSVAPYVGYKLNSYLTINGRAEYYRDQGGYTVGGTGISANYYAGTFGVDIHPFPNNDILQWLQLRPEVRYDYSDRPAFNAAHTGAITGTGDYDQFTVAMDAIMQF